MLIWTLRAYAFMLSETTAASKDWDVCEFCIQLDMIPDGDCPYACNSILFKIASVLVMRPAANAFEICLLSSSPPLWMAYDNMCG